MLQAKGDKSSQHQMNKDAKTALQRFEMENEIIQEDTLYFFDENEVDKLFEQKPWKKK